MMIITGTYPRKVPAMSTTTVLVALHFDEDDLEMGDVAEAVHARLDEVYPDSTGGFAQPGSRRVVATTDEVAKHIFDALWVGLGNEDEMGDAALQVAHALSLPTDQVLSVRMDVAGRTFTEETVR
jgi:hypothetical protein